MQLLDDRIVVGLLLHSMIGYWHRHIVRPSVCNAVHCASQGRCTGLKVVPSCS